MASYTFNSKRGVPVDGVAILAGVWDLKESVRIRSMYVKVNTVDPIYTYKVEVLSFRDNGNHEPLFHRVLKARTKVLLDEDLGQEGGPGFVLRAGTQLLIRFRRQLETGFSVGDIIVTSDGERTEITAPTVSRPSAFSAISVTLSEHLWVAPGFGMNGWDDDPLSMEIGT